MESPAAAPPEETLTRDAHVTSDTPGRMRVRIKRDRQQPHLLQTVKHRLERHVGAGQVEVNPTTHSVLVYYDRHTRSSHDILSVLRDMGVIVGETARALGEDVPELVAGRSTTSRNIVDAMGDLDRRLSRWTGHQVDLKLLLPLALGGLGVWQLARRGLGLADVPAYVLIWYAFDSFWKFHGQPDADKQA